MEPIAIVSVSPRCPYALRRNTKNRDVRSARVEPVFTRQRDEWRVRGEWKIVNSVKRANDVPTRCKHDTRLSVKNGRRDEHTGQLVVVSIVARVKMDDVTSSKVGR